MIAQNEPIIMEVTYPVNIETLWQALTDLRQMQAWYFPQLENFKAVPGFETAFVVENEGRTFTHQWRVVEVVPLKKIKYTWQFKEYDGDSYTTFELFESGDETRLKLTDIVVRPFPDDIPEFKRESGVNGWTYLLKTSLKNYLSQSR